MNKVTAGFSMSLDGFFADSDDGVEHLQVVLRRKRRRRGYNGDTTFDMSREGAEFIEEAGKGAGVSVTARRTFDVSNAWGGKHPMDVPMVVVTHEPPKEWVNKPDSPTFVTEGGCRRLLKLRGRLLATRTWSWALPV